MEDGTDVDTLNEGLFPSNIGDTHEFVVRDLSNNTHTVSMISAEVTSTPVPVVTTINTGSGDVGYILFNDHIGTSEAALVDAINILSAASISDLVLDLRYNGGGYLAIAAQLSYMIAGPGPTINEAFETQVFNDKYPTTNPVTGEDIVPIPFIDQTIGFDPLTQPGEPLPTLDLSRVFVLTGSGTCSASESIINGLLGVDVEVIQIGSTTCGKPYGFYPQDNCGTTYMTIQFRGENAKGFGEYPDGYAPDNASGYGEKIPGCSVRDDFSQPLGDPNEERLAAALNYRVTGPTSCPTPSGASPGSGVRSITDSLPESDGFMPKSLWRQSRIIDR
jgi:hypothetical protein